MQIGKDSLFRQFAGWGGGISRHPLKAKCHKILLNIKHVTE